MATPLHRPSTVRRAPCELAQGVFDLGENLLDRIHVGAVGRQEPSFGAGRLNGLADAGDLVGAKVVHEDDVSFAQGRCEGLFDIGAEFLAVDGTIEDAGSGEAVPVSIGTQKGPPIGVQKGPLLWRIRNDRAESGRCAGQSRPKPRGGTIAWSSVRSRSQIACNASAVALSCRLSGRASSQAAE